jgi:hypothetical protein
MHAWNFLLALIPVSLFRGWYCGSPPIFNYYYNNNKLEEYDRLFDDFFSSLEGYCRNQYQFLESNNWGWREADFYQTFVFLTSIHVAIFLFFIALGIFSSKPLEEWEEELRTEVETIRWKEIGKKLSLDTIGTYVGAYVFYTIIFEVYGNYY